MNSAQNILSLAANSPRAANDKSVKPKDDMAYHDDRPSFEETLAEESRLQEANSNETVTQEPEGLSHEPHEGETPEEFGLNAEATALLEEHGIDPAIFPLSMEEVVDSIVQSIEAPQETAISALMQEQRLAKLSIPVEGELLPGEGDLLLEEGLNAKSGALTLQSLQASLAQGGASAEQSQLSMLSNREGLVSQEFGQLLTNLDSSEINGGEKPSPLSQPQSALQRMSGAAIPVVETPVAQRGWGDAVGEKVLWMASQNISEAELQLDPPELGPLQVKVVVSQDQAQVVFNSQFGTVRDALDQSAARLREMFAQEGLNLVDVDVSDQSAEQFAGQEEGSGGTQDSGQSSFVDDGGEEVAVNPTVMQRSTRLVDHYV
ncbi:flagellar hook-length control protein FliK [Marinibactrum halimedae]|uniref:Flagellar hook-length control protein-like C-terminal domain-containing protein n=1 Tax=Marinibactrum halimedae TaxID=1444977 RepID=A0AA37WQ59_9GAMM|nr:flagellar hook-length control protein FliK [Marinibactrum halimedae]MCD9458844.1 flagellar hook-length control protein FliK [Marinibactrum halimedae]GLS27696.1 hypothetical protein GCM10007877_34150 [Marinibactrum halimedae]